MTRQIITTTLKRQGAALLTSANPEHFLPHVQKRPTISLVDLENLARWELLEHRLARPLTQTHLIYVAKKNFGLPPVALSPHPQFRAAFVGIFQHDINHRESSDHCLTALGTYLCYHLPLRHTTPLALQVISNDKMALAVQSLFDHLITIRYRTAQQANAKPLSYDPVFPTTIQ